MTTQAGKPRYALINLGAMGRDGDSMFSLYGVGKASQMIEDGWVPCGTFVNERSEVLQTFYLPMESDDE